jgi:bis(5'-nucleosidyl)-tetraphosphatase
MRKLKACGVLVVRGQPIDSFLLMVHSTRLDLPKGHIKKGESDRQCALRELEEETGISADDIQLDPEFRFTTSYSVRPQKYGCEVCAKTTVIFLGRLKRELEIRVTEHEGFQWRNWEPPHKIQRLTIDPLLEALHQYLDG